MWSNPKDTANLVTFTEGISFFVQCKDKVLAFKIRSSKTKSRSLKTGMTQSASFTL